MIKKLWNATLAIALAGPSCEGPDNIAPTVFRGQVVWADDETPAPGATIWYRGSRDRGTGQAKDWIVDDTISVDEFGNFDFIVPGESDSDVVEEVSLAIYFGTMVEPDSSYGQSDLIFPPHITDQLGGMGTYFHPGEAYELTIALPR